MKEKKTVLAVVLGVSAVSLIAAIIAGLADSLSLLIDGKYIASYSDGLTVKTGVLQLIALVLGIATLAVCIYAAVKHKNLSRVLIILTAISVLYFIVSVIVFRATMPKSSYSGEITQKDYVLFLSFLTSIISVTVSNALVAISSLFLFRESTKDKEHVEESAVNNTEPNT